MRVGEPYCQLRGRSRVCFKVLLFISWLFFPCVCYFTFLSFFFFCLCAFYLCESFWLSVLFPCFLVLFFSVVPFCNSLLFFSFLRGKTRCLSRVILSSNIFFLCLIYISFFFLYIPSSTDISPFPPFAFLLKGVRFTKGERVRSGLQPFFIVRVFLLRK